MREFHNKYDYDLAKVNVQTVNRLKMFILKPIFIGLFTFSICFTTILITKIFAYVFNENIIFSLNIYDVLFAFIGFGIGFILELALNVRKIFFNKKSILF